MKVKLNSGSPVLRHNGKEYGPGDQVEMRKEDALKIIHHIENADEVLGDEAMKAKEAKEKEAKEKEAKEKEAKEKEAKENGGNGQDGREGLQL